MSRKKRQLTRRFLVFCEGDTEYYYVDEFRKQLQIPVNIRMEPVALEGGGYTSFLNKVKTTPDSNCIAKFILVDMDRYHNNPLERPSFYELVEYCQRKNRAGSVPHFLIVQNPDFEYAACVHSSAYRHGDTTKFIKDHWGYRSLQGFKADTQVFRKLNSGDASMQTAADVLRRRACYIRHTYTVDKTNVAVKVTDTVIDTDAETVKGSNFYELLDIVNG